MLWKLKLYIMHLKGVIIMEIGKNGENKNTKYNHVAPIDLDTIPDHEKE